MIRVRAGLANADIRMRQAAASLRARGRRVAIPSAAPERGRWQAQTGHSRL